MARKVLDVFFNLSTNRYAGAVSGNFFGHAVQHQGVNLFKYIFYIADLVNALY